MKLIDIEGEPLKYAIEPGDLPILEAGDSVKFTYLGMELNATLNTELDLTDLEFERIGIHKVGFKYSDVKHEFQRRLLGHGDH